MRKMQNLALSVSILGALLSSDNLSLGAQVPRPAISWTAVDSALGRTGAPQAGDVMKYSFPRGDMDVTVQGVKLKPGLALGSWIAFKQAGSAAIAMGDLVLTEDEVGPVMASLQASGIEQTALHNHVIGETPRVMYMHIHGHGDAVAIARGVRAALGLTKTPLATPVTTPAAPIDFDTTAVAMALGYKGKVSGGVYQVSIPRAEKIVEGAVEIPPSMGLATALNFQPTGGGKAAITGDFVMTGGEVNRVIRALIAHHIQPTGLHSHMLSESPRLFFMHFWANDDAVALARGLHAALAEMKVKAPVAMP